MRADETVNGGQCAKPAPYDDPAHDYLQFWSGRQYEHRAEEIAIAGLLGGRHFEHAIDVGGGFGRLCTQLESHADLVTLAEPSEHQLDLARRLLAAHPGIRCRRMPAHALEFESGSVDLVTMIRVLHHLPDPTAAFREIARVLGDDGCAIIEVANYVHFRNRLRHLVRGQRMPIEPVDIRSPANRKAETIPFVNHNPATVIRQLASAGLSVEATRSVSNLRSVCLKRILSPRFMIAAERVLQRPLATLYFGPSIFFRVRKRRAQST